MCLVVSMVAVVVVVVVLLVFVVGSFPCAAGQPCIPSRTALNTYMNTCTRNVVSIRDRWTKQFCLEFPYTSVPLVHILKLKNNAGSSGQEYIELLSQQTA